MDGTKILLFHNLFLAPVWEITGLTEKLSTISGSTQETIL